MNIRWPGSQAFATYVDSAMHRYADTHRIIHADIAFRAGVEWAICNLEYLEQIDHYSSVMGEFDSVEVIGPTKARHRKEELGTQ